MGAKKPVVLVTAVGAPPGLNCLRALAETARYQLIAADADPRSTGLYEYGVDHVVLPKAADPSYLPRLNAAIEKFGVSVVVPCIEEEVLVIAEHASEVKGRGATVLLPAVDVLNKAVNKAAATLLAAENGINYPKSICVPSSTDSLGRVSLLEQFSEQCQPPWIVKPAFGHGMRGVTRVHSLAEAKKLVCKSEVDLVAQEFIPAPVGSMYIVGLLYDALGRVARRFSSRSIRTLFPDGGPATAGVSVSRPDIINNTMLMISKLGGWRGPLMVEWLKDPRDGLMKFIEINPRIWGYSYLAVGAGLNFPEALVELALGHEVPPDPGFREGVTMLRTTRDLIFDRCPYDLQE